MKFEKILTNSSTPTNCEENHSITSGTIKKNSKLNTKKQWERTKELKKDRTSLYSAKNFNVI